MDDVLELPHIARPGVGFEAAQGSLRQRAEGKPVEGGEMMGEMAGERPHVERPRPQRRHFERDDVEAVKEILAEAAGGDFLF